MNSKFIIVFIIFIHYFQLAIDNSKLICSMNEDREMKHQGCLDKLTSLFYFTTEKVKNTAYIIKNINLKQKIYETGTRTINVLKTIGDNVVDKGKNIYV